MSTGMTFALLVGVLAGADPATDALERREFTQVRMGVPITITVYSATEEAANRAVSAAYGRIRKLNDLLSDYDADSELMRLCAASGPGRPVEVSPELFFVLSRAESLSKQTDGAFDVTVGPIVQLWRKARRLKQLPDEAALREALRRVGWRNVSLDAERRTVELRLPNMRLDLGGIAKGYAADEALRILKTHGITRALVAAAGDIVAGDAPPGRTGWRIGVGPLDNPEAPPKTFISLANGAVSTSGDAYQFVEIGGRRYSHIVDPATGLGLTRHCSATVIAKDGATSDSVATAACILGVEGGLRLMSAIPQGETLIVERLEDGAVREGVSRGWARHVIDGE